MMANTKFVWNTFDMVKPGEVFFFNGDFFIKLYPTDLLGRAVTNNAVEINGEERTFEENDEVYRCPNAVLSISK